MKAKLLLSVLISYGITSALWAEESPTVTFSSFFGLAECHENDGVCRLNATAEDVTIVLSECESMDNSKTCAGSWAGKIVREGREYKAKIWANYYTNEEGVGSYLLSATADWASNNGNTSIHLKNNTPQDQVTISGKVTSGKEVDFYIPLLYIGPQGQTGAKQLSFKK